jgi:hypothetical protein
LAEFNHIHLREADEWVCRRSLWIGDRPTMRVEGRDSDEGEACRSCAESVLDQFGDAMRVH